MAIQTVQFTVDGQPVGKGRPRFSVRGGRAVAYTPDKTRAYEEKIRQAAWVAMAKAKLKPTDRRVSVIMTAFFEIPKSYTKKQVVQCQAGILIPKRPDIDNVQKAVMDACNNVVMLDDGQVWHVTAFKRYVDFGQEPCLNVKFQWDDGSI